MRAREGERNVYREKEGNPESACMKLSAFEHPKTLTLKSMLKCTQPTVIGHLELFWRFTAQHAPRGNVGKWPDAAIAQACGWDGDASVFVLALQNSGFVDSHDEFRLVVHDWPEHCPQWVRAQIAKTKLNFCSKDASSEPSSVASSEPSTIPSLAKPIPREDKNQDIGQQVDRDIGFEKFWKLYPKHVKKRESKKVWHAKRLETDLQTILEDIHDRSLFDRRWKEGFIPDPPTYLRGERWFDEIDRSVKPVETWKLTDAQLISKCAQVGISTVGRSRAMLQAELKGKR